jgi:hypothetical protein
MEQALTALWLLSTYGGVGSKARKGYGSLRVVPDLNDHSLDHCSEVAKRLRQWASANASLFPKDFAVSAEQVEDPSAYPALALRLGPVEWECKSSDPKVVIEKIDSSYQSVACELDRPQRVILGLPRKGLRFGNLDRHASPVHIHVSKTDKGEMFVRAIAFPSDRLDVPRDRTCKDLLDEFLRAFQKASQPWAKPPRIAADRSPAKPPKRIEKGQSVTATLCRTEAGWTVRFEGDGRPVIFDSYRHQLQDGDDGRKVECFIIEANKQRIKARLQRFL